VSFLDLKKIKNFSGVKCFIKSILHFSFENNE